MCGILILELQIVFQNTAQIQRFRASMGNCQHVHAEGILQLCLFIQNVADFFDVRILFQFQNDADSFLAGLVGNIHHIG